MTDLRAMVRVHWGRWVADCPRPGCANAEHFGRDDVTGHVGGLTGDRFRCAHCTLTCPAIWPAEVDDINRLLSQRPVPSTRNWVPGETLHDLLLENVEHGILPAAVLGGGGFRTAVSGDGRLAIEAGVH